jgi:hypothetical protein
MRLSALAALRRDREQYLLQRVANSLGEIAFKITLEQLP